MAEVRVKEMNRSTAFFADSKDSAQDRVFDRASEREHYEKPSVKRKKKSEAAKKRKYKG